ncbi:hypothetical protein I312_102549 [Cryptococcus bacillisporus CA1280]|uniref:uncharacterized protein n=1 Tax=Cryptococcus bacillisporus CA1280 TaxID=1296109 RepID=UPI0033679915
MPRDYSPSIGSASTYSPVLINLSSRPRLSFVPPPPSRRLNLRYAYPLVPLALLDALHTFHYHISAFRGLPGYVLTIGIARALVLFAVGCTQRWRARGGWVGLGGAFGGLGTVEYLVFLLLLRLSPSPFRINPLALRLPRSHTQTDMPFAFQTESAILTPGSSRVQRQMHGRNVSNVSRATMRSDWSRCERGVDGEGNVFRVKEQFMEGEAGEDADEDDEDDDGSDEYEDYTSDGQECFPEDDDVSSVSSSSIIDLPPPLSLAALSVPTLPPSLSISSHLGALDTSPMIGPLVRRTRSAKFLGRSWGSSREREVDGEAELGLADSSIRRDQCTREIDEGYGTFND